MDDRYRFVVDVNVGRLARWLRVMGYDAVFPRDCDDNGLVRIALKENRVLVTRDSGFAPRRVARHGLMRMVQVRDDDLDGQLRATRPRVKAGHARRIHALRHVQPALDSRVQGTRGGQSSTLRVSTPA